MSNLSRFVEVMREVISPEKLVLADVGAAEGIQQRWLPFMPLIKTIGFEPNRTEFEKIKSSSTGDWINAAVAGTDGQRTIHLTRRYNNSSLLLPNYDLIEQLEWSNDFDVVSDVKLECVTLDNALAGVRTSFLKLDTQGSEHEILLASQRVLTEDVVSIEIEVSFCELYKDQPQFADVDHLVQQHCFYLQDLANLLFVKPRSAPRSGGPKGRLIQGDALYFKDPNLLVQGSNLQIAGALVAYVAYGYPELGLQLFDTLKTEGRNFVHAAEIRALLQGMKPFSSLFSWLPGWNFAARCCKRLWLGMRPVSHSLWETELGNRI